MASNGRYDTVTLDMGFTLVDVHTGFDRQLLQLAQEAGYALTLEDVHRALAGFWRQRITEDASRVWQPSAEADVAMSLEMDRDICLRLGITDAAVHVEANRRARERFQDLAAFTIFPDVIDALQELRRIVPTLGIISNWDWQLPEICAGLGLAGYFDFIITSARVGATKPNPAIFRAALAHTAGNPAACLHVGDSLHADVRGAQAVGITGVLLNRQSAVSPPAEPADYPVIRSLPEIFALL